MDQVTDMADVIRVVLADDHPLMRRGTRQILEDAPRIVVVGEAADGIEALRLAHELKPDVLVLDVELPALSGVEVARRLGRGEHPIPVLALSAYDDEHYIIETLKAGAAGYMTKDEEPEEIVMAVRDVARGHRGRMSHGVSQKIWDGFTNRLKSSGSAARTYGDLSEREIEVLAMLRRGLTNEQIAEGLCLAVGTVKNHTTNIYSKLGVRNRQQAVAWAERHGVGRSTYQWADIE